MLFRSLLNIFLQGPSVSWNLRDVNDLEVDMRFTNAHVKYVTLFAQLSVANILIEKQTITWAQLFEQVKHNRLVHDSLSFGCILLTLTQFKSHILRALLEQAPKV